MVCIYVNGDPDVTIEMNTDPVTNLDFFTYTGLDLDTVFDFV